MPFIVHHQNNTSDIEFETYTRLLRQQGVDLGRSPRYPEPIGKRRWLYVWDSADNAQQFFNELQKRTGHHDWRIAEIDHPYDVGPLGPLIVQVTRHSDGATFGLHPLSRALLTSAYPDSKAPATSLTINQKMLRDYLTVHQNLSALITEVVPSLTGLNLEQLDEIGYVLIDDDTQKTLLSVPPTECVAN